MRAVSILASCLLILSTTSGSRGQEPDIATDQELLAAYCVGAAQEDLKTGRNTFPTEAAKQADLDRFRSYLAARGLLAGFRSILAIKGVNLAVRRGFNDESACNDSRDHCIDGCLRLNQAGDCVEKCGAAHGACERTAKCAAPDTFPF